jgi:hypothetical protein
MDDLDRLYRRLVHNIRATRPEYLQIPFTVQELYEQLVPYRHNRREMAIETNQDYEAAVALLLSGERGYVRVDSKMQDALQREIASPTGDPGIFKEYAQAQLTLTPLNDVARVSVLTPVGRPDGTPTDIADAAPTIVPAAPAQTGPGAQQEVPSLLSSLTSIPVPTGCRFCGGTLPEDRDANYCPHCGENLKTQHCPACGAEMDNSWKFCVACGRRAG